MGRVPKVTLMIQCKVDGIWKKVLRRCLQTDDPGKFRGLRFIFGTTEIA
jgi:hypothetical protein